MAKFISQHQKLKIFSGFMIMNNSICMPYICWDDKSSSFQECILSILPKVCTHLKKEVECSY